MQALLDRLELNEVMNRYAQAIDLRDWARLETVFVDGEIEADFTSMGVRQPYRGPATGWIDMVRSTIMGFDATQHFFANHSVELDGDHATDTRYMQARHVLGAALGEAELRQPPSAQASLAREAHYTIGGYYTSRMLRTPAGWRVAGYTLKVTFTDGDRRLMGIAYRKFTGRL